MPLQRGLGVRQRHANPVIRDPNQPTTGTFKVNLNTTRPRVERIFDKLFDHRRRALNDFARRDLIHGMGIEQPDLRSQRRHGFTILDVPFPQKMTNPTSLYTTFCRHLIASDYFPSGSRVLVGYSGGADSTCLLHMMTKARVDVVAAHLHHGQRAEADDEAQRCAVFAESLGILFASGRSDVPRLARDRKVGLEEAGRLARYEFFRLTALQTGCSHIATAHTRDDHVETVLLHLARGTGLAGLAGIAAVQENLVRPLLPFTRAESRAYCAENDLWFHDDPANSDIDFSRARIRHRVMPELRTLNPRFDEAVARLAELARADNAYLDAVAAAGLEACEQPLNGPLRGLTADLEVALDGESYVRLPEALFRRGLRLASGYLGSAVDSEQVALVAEGMAARTSGSVTAEGGDVVIEWSPRRIHLRRLVEEPVFRENLLVPGTTTDSLGGWSLEIQPWPPNQFQQERVSLSAVIDADRATGALYVRNAGEGDRIQALGMEGTKLISDIFQEMGLTAAARRRLPVVCDLIGPVWVPGGPLATRVAILESSTRAWRLELKLESA